MIFRSVRRRLLRRRFYMSRLEKSKIAVHFFHFLIEAPFAAKFTLFNSEKNISELYIPRFDDGKNRCITLCRVID